jgi:hypothetical protein
MPEASRPESTQCTTPGCPNETYGPRSLACLAREERERALREVQDNCLHTHSITGDFSMVQRLLPEYRGGHPQPGYMLDVCKACLKELPERSYTPSPFRGHRLQRPADLLP